MSQVNEKRPYSDTEESVSTPDGSEIERDIENDGLPAYSSVNGANQEPEKQQQPQQQETGGNGCGHVCRRCRRHARADGCKKNRVRCRMMKFFVVFFMMLMLFGTFTAKGHCGMRMKHGRKHGMHVEVAKVDGMIRTHKIDTNHDNKPDVTVHEIMKPEGFKAFGEAKHGGPPPSWFDMSWIKKWIKGEEAMMRKHGKHMRHKGRHHKFHKLMEELP